MALSQFEPSGLRALTERRGVDAVMSKERGTVSCHWEPVGIAQGRGIHTDVSFPTYCGGFPPYGGELPPGLCRVTSGSRCADNEGAMDGDSFSARAA